jgi:hypothetical protein
MEAQTKRRPKRPVRVEGDLAYIQLSRGYETVIDAKDLDLVGDFTWSATGYGRHVYAATAHNGQTLRMHRVIVGAPADSVVDHINGNTMDNRRENLRACTHPENMANRYYHRTIADHGGAAGQSGCRGVYPLRSGFVSRITTRGRQIDIKRSETVEGAAEARDWALSIFREPAADDDAGAMALVRKIMSRSDISASMTVALVRHILLPADSPHRRTLGFKSERTHGNYKGPPKHPSYGEWG